MRSAADTIKPVLLELGGKNALIAFADAHPAAVADAMIAGMNFAWCGQSCGSTSRAFLHAGIHDRVLDEVKEKIRAFRPGLPEDWQTTMGAIVNHAQYDRILSHIEAAKKDGATLVCGGGPPSGAVPAGGFTSSRPCSPT
jgi:betaine-aldehyde dehydrogenase